MPPGEADEREIRVEGTVRGLCSSKGFLFADLCEFAPKGFEGRCLLYEVS